MARYKRRVDSNHTQILKDLTNAGFSVVDTHTLGGGFGDVLIGLGGINFLVEIKTDDKSRLSAAEIKLRDRWKGNYIVGSSAVEITLRALKVVIDLRGEMPGLWSEMIDMVEELGGKWNEPR